MKETLLPPRVHTRRRFLETGGGLASAAWIAANWPAISIAAGQAAQSGDSASVAHARHGEEVAPPPPAALSVLTASEAADVEAIANQIVPDGETPGAREAHVLVFIDRALGSFFAAQLPAFRQGLQEFQQAFATRSTTGKSFALCSDARQIEWLHGVEQTPFFQTLRRLTVLGLVASPRYGGNHDKTGWKLLGFDDRHVWQPPFGHYDRDYPGFEPYPGTKPWMAAEKPQS